MDLSTLILFITGLFIAWQAWETRRLAELTRIKDRPFLEVEFQKQGRQIMLKNIGQSPAYSPSISTLKTASNECFVFDPLHTSCLAIPPGESRIVWMQHRKMTGTSTGGFGDSTHALQNALINRKMDKPLKIVLQYFDKDRVKISRALYLNVGGERIGDKYIYTSTTSE